MDDASSRLDVLGPSRVVDASGRPVPTPPRVRRLLAILLARPGHSVSLTRLEALLWDGAPPASAHNRVQAAVSALRRAILAAGLDQRASVESDGRGYAIEIPAPLVDHQRFAALVHTAADDDGPARVRSLRAALGLWRGDPFADVPSARDRLTVVRTLEALRSEAETMLADSLEDLDRPTEALSVLSVAFRRAPADERIAETLMRMYVGAGRRSAALEVFAAARTALRDGFGADPNPELAALHMELMGATATRPRPAATIGAGRRSGRAAAGVRPGVRSRTLLASNTGRRFICVTGDAGAGKTAIVRHLMGEAAAHGAVCLLGSAHPGGSQLEPLLDASHPLPELRTIAERAAESWAHDEAPAAATAAVERALAVASATGPIVLVVEDLQWADDATMQTLRHLARTADRGNLAVIVSFNPNEDHRRRATRTVDGIGRYVAVERMSAAALTATSTERAIASVLPDPAPEFIESLLQRGAANMGAVVELATAVSAAPEATTPASLLNTPLPTSVRDRVERQLRGLSADACRALALAASFAHEHGGVTPEDVTDSQLPLDTVEDVFAVALRRRFLVVVEGHRFRFRTRLIEEVLRTMLSPLESRTPAAAPVSPASSAAQDTDYLQQLHDALTAATAAEPQDPAAAHALYLEALVLCTQHEIGGSALTLAADGVSRTDSADIDALTAAP